MAKKKAPKRVPLTKDSDTSVMPKQLNRSTPANKRTGKGY